jgi:hypothetical protein
MDKNPFEQVQNPVHAFHNSGNAANASFLYVTQLLAITTSASYVYKIPHQNNVANSKLNLLYTPSIVRVKKTNSRLS